MQDPDNTVGGVNKVTLANLQNPNGARLDERGWVLSEEAFGYFKPFLLHAW